MRACCSDVRAPPADRACQTRRDRVDAERAAHGPNRCSPHRARAGAGSATREPAGRKIVRPRLHEPLSRAAETCRLAGVESRAEARDELLEWNYGASEGRRTTDIRKAHPRWTPGRTVSPWANLRPRPHAASAGSTMAGTEPGSRTLLRPRPSNPQRPRLRTRDVSRARVEPAWRLRTRVERAVRREIR